MSTPVGNKCNETHKFSPDETEVEGMKDGPGGGGGGCDIVLQRLGDGGGKYAEIRNPSPEVLVALNNVGEDDPAICLDWNFAKLSDAVEWANNHAQALALPLPAWYNAGGVYPITVAGIQEGLVTLLAQCGSGQQFGMALLAPNTLEQYSRIRDKIQELRLVDPFVLAICGGDRCPLALVYVLADGKRKTVGEHMPMLPLPQGIGVKAFE